MKIYNDDPNLPYKTTKLNALYTRSEIDGELAKWGVKQSAWTWDPDKAEIWIEFRYTEQIRGITVTPIIRIDAPLVFKRARAGGHGAKAAAEAIDWNVSLRVMYWFIHSHLAAAITEGILWSALAVLLIPANRRHREKKEG